MTQIINIADLPDDPNNPDGPTIREVNQAETHKIPVGTLVEVKLDSWYGDGACMKAHARLYVVTHNRDCDGTPLYCLSEKKREWFEHFGIDFNSHSSMRQIDVYCKFYDGGFAEESLTPIEITDEIKEGSGSLNWRDDD